MTTVRRLAAGTLVAAATLALTPSPANAAIVERLRFTDAFSGEFEDCGTQWTFDFETAGLVHLRLDDDGDLVLAQENRTFTQTITNTATGRSAYLSGHTLWREAEAVREGDTITVDVRQTGVPVVVTDDSGSVVLRDRGRISFVDTYEVVDGEIEFVGEEVVADKGGHPLYYAPFCDVFVPITS